MPFTFACFVIGGLALSAIPPFSGFFSKDEILYVIGERGGWYWALYVAGYVGAFITAVYTWRMIFRAFLGDPVPEAQELAHGHLHHPEQPTNPATGEVEDTDVGFPGPEHHIAEQSMPMKLAMGTLAVLSIIGGVVLIPEVFTPLDHFLEPTFAESAVELEEPFAGFLWLGFALSAGLGALGILVAYRVWVQRPGTSARVQARFSALHRLFVNKWFFDQLYDWVVVKPFAALGRFAQAVFERFFVNDTLVGGPTGLVRAGSAAVRALQSGYLRAYAGLLLAGVVVVAFWFLVQAS
jgi:NADH-quinone oxidoreductase subunit L